MPFLPGLLRIHMKFERMSAAALESHNYKQLQDIFENFSLNGGNGPGYFGYLFYNVYEINLMIVQYNILITELNLYGKEYLRRNHIKNIRLLRRSFTRLLSIQEQRFMRRYGITEEWLRIKILGRSPSMKIENYYYKVLMEDIESRLKEGIRKNNLNLVREAVFQAVKLGIELSLILGWFLLYMIYSYKILKKIMDKDDIIELFLENTFKEYSVKILHQLSEYYSVNIGRILRFLPHRLHITSLNTYGSIKRDKFSIAWLGVIERCWVRVFVLHLYKSGLTDEDDVVIPCKICLMSWEGIYDYISHNFEKVDINNIQKDKHICYLSIKAYYNLSADNHIEKPVVDEKMQAEHNDMGNNI